MVYTLNDYYSDKSNPEMPHIKSKERFENFYEVLGTDEIQKTQVFQIGNMQYLKPRGKILELGCHIGFNLIYYAGLGYECVGVDIAQSLLDIAKEKISKEHVEIQKRITLEKAWIEDYKPKEKYGTVILTETLEHVIEPKIILEKAKECLSDDGVIFISAPSWRNGSYSHVRGISLSYMENLVKEVGGLKISEVFVNDSNSLIVSLEKDGKGKKD